MELNSPDMPRHHLMMQDGSVRAQLSDGRAYSSTRGPKEQVEPGISCFLLLLLSFLLITEPDMSGGIKGQLASESPVGFKPSSQRPTPSTVTRAVPF